MATKTPTDSSQSPSDPGRAYEYLFIRADRRRNDATSKALADEVAKALTKRGQPTAVVEIEQHGVDAILDVDGIEVAVELTAYIQKDEYHDRETAIAHACEAIADGLLSAGSPPVNVVVNWLEEDRRNTDPSSARVMRVARGHDLKQFTEELAALAEEVLRTPEIQDRQLLFRQGERAQRLNKGNAPYWNVDAERYPMCASYCRMVRIARHNGPGWPQIRSESARFMGLDEVALANVVTQKVQKLVRYRESTGDRPLWLVVHADCWPPSCKLPGAHRDRAIEVIREACCGEPSFDAVWFAMWTGCIDATELERVR